MKFTPTELAGAFIIDIEPKMDERGFFARSWCQKEFAQHGVSMEIRQCNISFNKKKGTVRGMHYSAPPHEEAKIVCCTAGAIHDIIIDLRPNSPTFRRYTSVNLDAQNRRALFIPAGFAHGFQTLSENTDVFYQMSEFYVPEFNHGVRWNDPAFKIKWPLPISVISKQDQQYSNWELRIG